MFFKVLAIGILASLLCFGMPGKALAQTALCPANAPGLAPVGTGIGLSNGACTNGKVGSFSGASLASQALSELSQTTSQETTRNTENSISDRREQEIARCAEGFSRVNGVCERNQPALSQTEPVSPPPPAASGIPHAKAAKKAKNVTAPRTAPAVYRAPPAPAAPIIAEPAIRFGAWAQVNGDYEHRNATGSSLINCCVVAGYSPAPLTLGVQSRTGTVGFQAGADFTSRGLVLPNDGLIAGFLTGYSSSNLTLNTQALSGDFIKVGNEYAHLHATIDGPTVGLYTTYFSGGFSADFLFKLDILNLSETFNDSLAFCACFGGSIPYVPFSGSGSVSLIDSTIAANLNYRFDLSPNFWVQPTVGSQFTNLNYGSNAAQLGLADGSIVMIQGGARIGTTALLNGTIPATLSLTGLAYDDVLVKGGFLPGAASAGNNILAQSDQGQVRGRGVVAANFDFGGGVSSFIQAEVRGGTGLFGAGGKAGVRVEW